MMQLKKTEDNIVRRVKSMLGRVNKKGMVVKKKPVKSRV
jgi:hypothetical protein